DPLQLVPSDLHLGLQSLDLEPALESGPSQRIVRSDRLAVRLSRPLGGLRPGARVVRRLVSGLLPGGDRRPLLHPVPTLQPGELLVCSYKIGEPLLIHSDGVLEVLLRDPADHIPDLNPIPVAHLEVNQSSGPTRPNLQQDVSLDQENPLAVYCCRN